MFLRTLCIGLSLISLIGCEEKRQKEAHKPLIVMTSPDNPPFEFKDTARGGDQVIGFDMDIIQKVSETMGQPIKIVETDFSAIIPSLQSGRADMAIAAIAPTKERRLSVDFSDPYYAYKFALLVPENATLTSEKSLNDKRLGVQIGSSHELLANQWKKTIPGLSVTSLNKVGELVQELKNGRLQAVLLEDTTARKIAALTPGLKIVTLNIQGEPLVIAFPKGSPWVAPVNKALKAAKGDVAQIAQKWFSQ